MADYELPVAIQVPEATAGFLLTLGAEHTLRGAITWATWSACGRW